MHLVVYSVGIDRRRRRVKESVGPTSPWPVFVSWMHQRRRSTASAWMPRAVTTKTTFFDLLRPVDMASAFGVTNRTMIRRLKAESKQAELPASVDRLMDQLQSQLANKGVLDALPLSSFVDRKKQTAMETDRLREWLQSSDGKAWKTQRAETWSTASWALLKDASAFQSADNSGKTETSSASPASGSIGAKAKASGPGLVAWFPYFIQSRAIQYKET